MFGARYFPNFYFPHRFFGEGGKPVNTNSVPVMWHLNAVVQEVNLNAVAQDKISLKATAATSYDFQIVINPNS